MTDVRGEKAKAQEAKKACKVGGKCRSRLLLRRTAAGRALRRTRRTLRARGTAEGRAIARATGARRTEVVGRGRSRTVRRTNARVVLRAAPAETDARVTDGVSLHLVDGHLSGVAVDKLHKAAALARRDLDVGDLTEALEETAELILGNVARKTTNKNRSVVGVGELVHLLLLELGSSAIALVELGTGGDTVEGLRLVRVHGRRHLVALLGAVGAVVTVLGRRGGDAHGSVTAVDALHLDQSTLLVLLVREANEAVTTALSGHSVGHDLSRLAGGEASLKQRDEDEFVHLRAEVANEDGELGTAVITAIVDTAARGPVELEHTGRVRDRSAVEGKSLGGSISRVELNEAVSSIARALVTDDLHIDLLTGGSGKDTLDEVLVHPRLEFSHPEGRLVAIRGVARASELVGVGRITHAGSNGSSITISVCAVGTRSAVVVGLHAVHCFRLVAVRM